MKKYKRIITGEANARWAAIRLIERSAWFEFTPFPDDQYEIQIKDENVSVDILESVPDKKGAESHRITLNQLAHFQRDVSEWLMQSIFGESLGTHIWREHMNCNASMLPMWKLDLENTKKLAKYIAENYPEK